MNRVCTGQAQSVFNGRKAEELRLHGEFSKVKTEVQRASQLDDSPFISVVRAGVYGYSGDRDEAVKLLNDLRQLSRRRYVCPYEVATAYVGLGEKDEALKWFQKEHRNRSICMIWLKNDRPWNHNLRSDLRFQDLQRRIGLPP